MKDEIYEPTQQELAKAKEYQKKVNKQFGDLHTGREGIKEDGDYCRSLGGKHSQIGNKFMN